MKTPKQQENIIKDLRLKIHKLQSSLNKKSANLERLKYNKKLETLKHELRVSCKNKDLDTVEKYKNYIYGLTLK